MLKFIAPKVLKANNKPSPCYCEDNIVCEYCTQANLILYEKEQVQNEEVKKAVLEAIKAVGIRKTARLLQVNPSTISRWIHTENIPRQFMEKLRGVAQA